MKIFCIGLHKTATLSLATALDQLGYRVRHGYKPQSDLIKNALYDKAPPLAYLEQKIGKHDVYADLYAVRDHFVWLDRYYTDAKFILTTREENEWVEPVQRQKKKRPDSPYFHHWYYQSELQWRMHKRMHEKCVGKYFEDKQTRFLEMDITKGDGWTKLCSFLGGGIPDTPFPHKNKSVRSL